MREYYVKSSNRLILTTPQNICQLLGDTSKLLSELHLCCNGKKTNPIVPMQCNLCTTVRLQGVKIVCIILNLSNWRHMPTVLTEEHRV